MVELFILVKNVVKSGFCIKEIKRKMTVLLVYGGVVLFVFVVVTLAVITTKYSQKHNPEDWCA